MTYKELLRNIHYSLVKAVLKHTETKQQELNHETTERIFLQDIQEVINLLETYYHQTTVEDLTEIMGQVRKDFWEQTMRELSIPRELLGLEPKDKTNKKLPPINQTPTVELTGKQAFKPRKGDTK